jgi:hypothetical protein
LLFSCNRGAAAATSATAAASTTAAATTAAATAAAATAATTATRDKLLELFYCLLLLAIL